MDESTAAATQFFAEHGYDLVVERRDLHAEMMAQGRGGRASFYAPGVKYFCVSLRRDGVVVWADIGHGVTIKSALAEATIWYRR